MKVARQLGKVDVCSFARATGSSHGDGTNVEDAHKQEDSTWQTSNSTLQETKQCTRANNSTRRARVGKEGAVGGSDGWRRIKKSSSTARTTTRCFCCLMVDDGRWRARNRTQNTACQ
jgi:hypothetical protein